MTIVLIIMVLSLAFYAGLVLYCWSDWNRRARRRTDYEEMLRRLRG